MNIEQLRENLLNAPKNGYATLKFCLEQTAFGCSVQEPLPGADVRIDFPLLYGYYIFSYTLFI